MWDKLLPWIGGIFAGLGLILIFFDIISSIKRRDKAKTNVVGLVLLSMAVIGYTITDLILKDSAWPPLASLIWIALFWAYVIIDACLTMGVIKKARRNRKAAASVAEEQTEEEIQDIDISQLSDAEQEQYATDHSEGGKLWKQKYASKKVAVEKSTAEIEKEKGEQQE